MMMKKIESEYRDWLSKEKGNVEYFFRKNFPNQYAYYRKWDHRIAHEEIIGTENIKYNEEGISTHVNHFSGPMKDYWEKATEPLKKYNISTLDDVVDILYYNTPLTQRELSQYFSGYKAMPATHFFYFLKVLGVDQFGSVRKKFFSSEIQKDRLILTRNVWPKFHINAKINDWYDCHFEVEFKENIPLKRFIDYVFMLTEWYFKFNEAETTSKEQLRQQIADDIEHGVSMDDEKLKFRIECLQRFDDNNFKKASSKSKNPYTDERLTRFIKGKYYFGELPLGKYHLLMSEVKPKMD